VSESEKPKVKVNLSLSPAARFLAELDRGGRRREPRPWVLPAMALALVRTGRVPRAGLLARPDADEPPVEEWEVRAFGSGRGAKRAVRRGLLPPGELGGWTAGFLAGLLDAGAIVREGSSTAMVPDSAPSWLRDELLNRPPFHFDVERVEGGFRMTGVWMLIAKPPRAGVERLAGILAGSPRVGGWVAVRGGWCRLVLKRELVPYSRRTMKRGIAKVSVFWRALLAPVAPEAARGWMGSLSGVAGDCPRTPWAVWVACLGGTSGLPRGPVTGGLPWMMSYGVMRNHGLGLRELKGVALKWWPAGPRGWVRWCGLWWVRRVGLLSGATDRGGELNRESVVDLPESK